MRAQFPLDPSVVAVRGVRALPAHRPGRRRDRLSPGPAVVRHRADAPRGVPRSRTRSARAAGNYTGAVPGEFALTDSTTMGIAHMYGGLSLSADDEVLSTTHDFFSTEEALRLLALRSGAKVRRVTLYDDPATATVDEMTSRLIGAVGPRTRVVAITWVHSSTGVRAARPGDRRRARRPQPGPRPAGAAVRRRRARLRRRRRRPADLGCDFLSAGTHKWLFGPRGTGILWARNWGPLTELIPSFSGLENGARLTPGGYHDFEHRLGARGGVRVPHADRPGPSRRAHGQPGTASSRTGCRASAAGRSGSSHPPTRRSRPASSASTSRRCCRATR